MPDLDTSNSFEPDWALSPGTTIGAILSARRLSRESFASSIGESVEVVQRLLLGLEAVDEDLAERLSKSLGSSRAFWIARENQFRRDLRRFREAQDSNQRAIWVKQFPVREMIALGWIRNVQSPAEAASECLRLFGVPDIAAWQSRYSGASAVAAFRTSAAAKKNPGAVAAWLRWAELVAERTPCNSWNATVFQNQLQMVRRLTWQKDPASFLPVLRRLCAEAGVAVVVARTPNGCPASGATRFLTPYKAMIVLSFRYRTDDQFWFTFFHEAGHLLLHGPGAIFIEDDSKFIADEEAEANDFSRSILIPPEYYEEFYGLDLKMDNIICFARRIGVAPGLIVGQMQHLKRIPHDRFNWLKRRYKWNQIDAGKIIP